MNKKIKSLFAGIIASTLAMALFFGCANGNDGGSPNLTAAVIVNSMKFGWNLGNTLDAHEGEE